jgi:hypothetical protein
MAGIELAHTPNFRNLAYTPSELGAVVHSKELIGSVCRKYITTNIMVSRNVKKAH